jgi:phage terminase large subunit-like protein
VLSALQSEKQRRLTEDRLKYYEPYPKQLEFHAAGAAHRERLLMAGNQLGKTLAGGFEAAIHATGRYPDWWEGRRFDRPTVGWCCGIKGEVVRDTVQKVLVGRPGQIGTGADPKDALGELVTARGIADLLDVIKVRHESGGTSLIGLKTYASGLEKFQGESLDWAWADEECPIDIYT